MMTNTWTRDSLASAAAREIPSLRRHAVLLLDGDRGLADALINDCVEQAATLRPRARDARDPRALRVRLFTLLYRSLSDFLAVNADDVDGLDRKPELTVAVMLLLALEGMSLDEAGEITGLDAVTVAFCAQRARHLVRDVMHPATVRPTAAEGVWAPVVGAEHGVAGRA